MCSEGTKRLVFPVNRHVSRDKLDISPTAGVKQLKLFDSLHQVK